MTITRRQVFIFVIGLFVVGLIHHADHVLRRDHSGWPFTDSVTPFTYSLLVYPILYSALRAKSKFYKVAISIVIALFVLGAHIFLETPIDEFHTWAYNSSEFLPALGQPNFLNVESGLMGWLSVVVGLILDIGVILLPFAFWKEKEAPEFRENTPVS